MSSAPPRVLVEAYRRWMEAQQQALALLEAAEPPDDPQDWAEGYRWLTRIASLCQDWILEQEDPRHPSIFHSQGPHRKLIVDNPDVDYLFASLDRRERYRLHGKRGSAAYLGLTIGTDVFRGAAGRTGTLVQTNVDRFHVAPDGGFSIVLSAEKPGSEAGSEVDWIPLPPGATQLAVRETFRDRRKERPAELHIERLGDPIPPPRAEPEVVAEKLTAMARFLLQTVNTCLFMWKGAFTQLNAIAGAPGRRHVEAQEDEVRTHSDADMVYMGGRFRLAPGEGLCITIRPPERPFAYWGLVLVNPWMESYDYRYAATHLSNGTAEANADGSWTLLVAPEHPRPGVRNWLDAGGRREGFMLLRWVLAEDPPAPTCAVVHLADYTSEGTS